MDTGIFLVGVILAITGILFVSSLVRVDLVAVLASLALAWLGLITPVDAVSGFASNAVIAMASVMIIAYGLEKTGITSRLAGAIVRYAGTGEKRINATIAITVGFLSSVMQTVGVAALFLPAVRRIGRQARIPVSRLMMPMGFAAILGGSMTMIASGPLIVLNDLLRQAGAEPFSLFAVTPIGLPLLIAGIVLFALAGDRILPKKEETPSGPSIAEIWGIDHPVRTCSIPPSSPLAGKTREDIPFRMLYGLDLLAVRTGKDISVAPSRFVSLEPGMELAFLGSEERFIRFIQESGCIPSGDRSRLQEILDDEEYGFAELVVRPRASIIGKTPREIMFRQTYAIEPIVHQHGETEIRAGISGQPLAAGDIIVAFGSWDTLRHFAGHQDLVLLTPPGGDGLRHGKGLQAILVFAAALGLTATGVPLSLALLTGAAGSVLLGILTLDEAYRAIDWKTITLIAGLIPLGIALEKSGAAAVLAASLVEVLAGFHPLLIMGAVAVLATVLSLIISNVAATVLLVPLVILLGAGTGTDPRALALLVAVCASNSFILPTHQVNALLMGPGGYSAADYLKAGSIMTVIFMVIAVMLIYLLIR
jgi:di/tricarboxylate transporter